MQRGHELGVGGIGETRTRLGAEFGEEAAARDIPVVQQRAHVGVGEDEPQQVAPPGAASATVGYRRS